MRWGSFSCAARTTMLRNGVMPMPPARRTAARAELLCSTRLPNGPSIFTWLPTGSFSNTRLKAEPRIRVAIRRVSSCGALASENVWVFPAASVSGGSINVKSTVWPDLKVHPGGFSKRKARVRSATSSCPSNLIIKAGDISGLTGDFSLNLKMFVRRLVRSARPRVTVSFLNRPSFQECPDDDPTFTLELDGLPAIIFSDLRLPHQDCAAVQRPFNAHLITQERRKRQGRSNEGMKNFLVRQNSSGKSHFQALLATVLITHVIVSGIGMIFRIAVCINQSPFPNGCPVFAGSFRRHLPLSARRTC